MSGTSAAFLADAIDDGETLRRILGTHDNAEGFTCWKCGREFYIVFEETDEPARPLRRPSTTPTKCPWGCGEK